MRTWLAFVLLAACSSSPVAAPSPSPSPSASAPAYVVARVDLGGDAKPCGVVGDGSAVWVSGFNSNTLYRIDPVTNAITDRVPTGGAPCGLAFGAGSIWTSDYGGNTATRVDVRTRRVVATIPVGKAPFDAAFGAGSAWITNGTDGTVSRISPLTNRVVAVISVGAAPAGVAVVGDSAWVPIGSGEVVRIAVSSNRVVGRVRVSASGATWLAHSSSALWVASPKDGTETEIDVRTGRVLGRTSGIGTPADGDVVGDDVWVPLRGTTGSCASRVRLGVRSRCRWRWATASCWAGRSATCGCRTSAAPTSSASARRSRRRRSPTLAGGGLA